VKKSYTGQALTAYFNGSEKMAPAWVAKEWVGKNGSPKNGAIGNGFGPKMLPEKNGSAKGADRPAGGRA
jgi:hypothetical protein